MGWGRGVYIMLIHDSTIHLRCDGTGQLLQLTHLSTPLSSISGIQKLSTRQFLTPASWSKRICILEMGGSPILPFIPFSSLSNMNQPECSMYFMGCNPMEQGNTGLLNNACKLQSEGIIQPHWPNVKHGQTVAIMNWIQFL